MTPFASLALVFAFSFLLEGGIFDGYREEAIPTGKLLSRGWSDEDLKEVIAELPRALVAVETKLRRKLEASFTTVLVPGSAELRKLVAQFASDLPEGQFVLGVALPEARLLVLRGEVPLGFEPFRITVLHEVAHLVLHRKAMARIPRWFDEGVATWVSGSLLSEDDEAYLAFLARVGGLYPLESLERAFPRGHLLTSTAYRQSFLFIAFLLERYGADSVPSLLDSFEEGRSVADAMLRMSHAPLEEVEGEFARWVARRQSLARALLSIVSVWTVAGLLLLLAIARHVIRRRRQMRALSAEDVPTATDDSGESDLSG